MLRKIAAFFISASMVLSSFTINSVFAADEETTPVVNNENIGKIAAFPGAEGGGMYATGAREAIANGDEMEVYHVTSLKDSGAGTFRDAVSKGNRIVVFDVSGIIDLETNITIGGGNKNNVTILGQTAPGDGICFRGNNIKVSGENIIMRYLRFRVGDKLANGSNTRTQDGLEVVDDTTNVIIDHCSVTWGTDENLTAYAVKDVTIQNCIIAEALNQSIHSKGEHSYAAIWGGVNLSVHHNIIATHRSRNPKIGTSETTAMTAGYEDKDTVVDIRNNIIYNWGDKAGYGSENRAKTNIVNNVYKPGPATPENKRARIFEFSVGKKHGSVQSGSVYAEGNFIDDDMDTPLAKSNAAAVNADNFQPDLKTGVYPDVESAANGDWERLTEPAGTKEGYLANYPVTTTDANTAYDYVLENAGARLPKFDLVDQRIVNNVKDRTAPNGSKGSIGLVDSPIDGMPADKAGYDDRGYPVFSNETRENTFDSDNDGIADVWEDKMGLDKTNPNDSLNIGPGGYTWLEVYAESIGEKESNGEITINSVTYNESKKAYDVDYTYSSAQGKTGKAIEYYSNGTMIKNVDLSGGSLPADYNVINLPAGENYVTVKLINSDDTYILSKAIVVYTNGADYSGDFSAVNNVYEENGKIYMHSSNGNMSSLGKNDLTDNFIFVANIDKISNLSNDVQTGVSIISESGEYVNIYKTYESGKMVLKIGKNDSNDETVSGIDAYKANMIKVSRLGDDIIIEAGESAAFLKQVAKVSYANDLKSGKINVSAYVATAPDTKETISAFDSIRFVEAGQITHPTAKIINIKNNQTLELSTNVDIEVTPDSKAEINDITVFLGETAVGTLKTPISQKGMVSVPIKFSGAAKGSLRVVCFDKNIGKAEDTVNVVVSDNIAPWSLETIGKAEGGEPAYVSYTRFYGGKNDFTYKIYSPEGGNISGNTDKYGYVYQKFNNDMRMYYRSRIQSSKNFGIMLKDNLDADGISYFFGCEPDGDGYKYVLKARTEVGGDYTTISTADLSGPNNYIIAEKDGNNFRIYKTENGDTVYKTKELLAETEIPFGDEYLMGFAATEGAPDAGWLTLESIERGNSLSYQWNMDYGMDWYWQSQETAILTPEWTTDEVGGKGTGKMVISTDDKYEERFVIREYTISEGTIESGFDVFITGEKAGIDFYLQTESGSAYKVGFNSGGAINIYDTISDSTYNALNWYSVKMITKIGENTADISVFDAEGNVVSEQKGVQAVNFTDVTNEEKKKTPINQGFFIKPLEEEEGSSGVYYIDNMYVALRDSKGILEKAVLAAKELKASEYTEESWSIFSKALTEAETVLKNENASPNDIMTAYNNLTDAIASLEELIGVTPGEPVIWKFSEAPFDTLTSVTANSKFFDNMLVFEGSSPINDSKKSCDNITFTREVRINTSHVKINVPNRCDIVVYASGTNKNARNIVISDGTNEKKYSVNGDVIAAEYSYEGSGAGIIDIYGTDNLKLYGIKYTPYVVIDRRKTGIKEYDKATGIAKIRKADDGITNAVMGMIVTDGNGRVVEFKKENVQFTGDAEQAVNIGKPSAEGNVKIFLWESTETMKPIGKAFKAQ